MKLIVKEYDVLNPDRVKEEYVVEEGVDGTFAIQANSEVHIEIKVVLD